MGGGGGGGGWGGRLKRGSKRTCANVSNVIFTLQGKQLCQIVLKYMHKCKSYGLDKLNLWPSYHLTFKCVLDLQPTQKCVSNGTTIIRGKDLRKIILESMHKCRSYGPNKLNILPFYHLTLKCDLDHQFTRTYDSNDTTTPQGEHLCKIILKSMRK